MRTLCYTLLTALVAAAALGIAQAGEKKLPAPRPAEPRMSAREVEAIRLLQLRQWNDARQQQIRAISNVSARHHELMMQIIDNMGPTRRHYRHVP